MKKFFAVILCLVSCVLCSQMAFSFGNDETALNRDLKVLTEGGKITYPIEDNITVMCYAKMKSGSIDAFKEFNDYFYMKKGKLYSDTMNKVYKPEKKKPIREVNGVDLVQSGNAIEIDDGMWEWPIRHHKRTIKINIVTGEYYMRGTQDNWLWYRDIVATGYCKEYVKE